MIDPLTLQAQAESIENRTRPVLELSHGQRDQLYEKLQRLFADMPHRFVADEPGRPRPERVQVRIEDNVLICEVWEPVLHRYLADEMVDAVPRLDGWNVYRFTKAHDILAHTNCDCVGTRKAQMLDGKLVHKMCGRPIIRTKTDAEIIANIKTMSLQLNDTALYNGFYPTIPGKDIITFDRQKLLASKHTDSDLKKMEAWQGEDTMHSRPDNPALKRVGKKVGNVVKPMYHGPSQVMRGGTKITGGRRQWREKTRDHVLWDGGVQKNWDDVRKHKQEQGEKKLYDMVAKVEAQIHQIAPDPD